MMETPESKMPNGVPPGVRRLLEGPIDSFEKLAIVVALGNTALTLSALADELKLQTAVVTQSVSDLLHEGLVQRESEGFVELVRTERVDELLRLHREDRMAIVSAISSLSIDRIRGMTARAFANAFDLRTKRRRDD
jgi:DNA-binding HxlR family transcriptional regulator